MKSLSDKWALVTGSSRGTGQQVATELAEQGCNIILHATLNLLRPFDIHTRVIAGRPGNEDDEQNFIHRMIEDGAENFRQWIVSLKIIPFCIT